MANHASAIKRHRQSLVRRERNQQVRSAVRTAVKKLRGAVSQGNKDQAKALFRETERVIARAVGKGLLHKNNGSRKIRRLALLLKK